MSKQNNPKEPNKLEKQIEEISGGQKNANNPGQFIGTGKTMVPARNLLKSPFVMIIAGVLILIPLVYNLVTDFSLGAILFDPAGIVVCLGFVIGGILRLRKKN